MNKLLLAGACALMLGLGACANGGGTVTVDLVHAQQQANAAVADIAAVEMNLMAQGLLKDSPQLEEAMQALNAANAAFQAMPSGTVNYQQLAQEVAKAVQAGLAAMGPAVPANIASAVNSAIAALNAYIAGGGLPLG